MRDTKEIILENLHVMLCIISAAILAASGISGWGWFLFIAVILYL